MLSAKEKSLYASPAPLSRRSPSRTGVSLFKTTTVALACVASTFLVNARAHVFSQHNLSQDLAAADVCPQAPALAPQRNLAVWESMNTIYGTDAFEVRAVDWLSGAVQIPTVTEGNMPPVEEDPARWKQFEYLHKYLRNAFPLVYTSLEITKVNTYGLIVVWRGSDSALKPMLLTAHQDVVPVAETTLDEWTYPPFSGYFDGELIWGRGSSDDKRGLIGALAAIETMLEQGFQPTRTVVLAFGFDEEVGGIYGAGLIAPVLLEMFEDGFAMLVDEGIGYDELYGTVFAMPGITEKGYLDVEVRVTSPGGHSAFPPPHTSIGILAELLVTYENNPFGAHLMPNSVNYGIAQCVAQYANEIPPSLRKDILDAEYSEEALLAAEEQLFSNPAIKALAGTTQAITIVRGGVKENALPEEAHAAINHRISVESSINETMQRDMDLLKPIATKFNLFYSAFGEIIMDNVTLPANGHLTLDKAGGKDGLGPAPVTPYGPTDLPYKLLSGTIKATYNTRPGSSTDENIIVIPAIMPANTDTQHYWKLTPNIFRYRHTRHVPGMHTVNEALPSGDFVEMIRFLMTLILNVDESDLA